MQRRHDDVRRLIVSKLNNQFGKVGLVRMNASRFERLVELNLFGGHRLDLDDLGRRLTVGPARLHQPDDDPPRAFGVPRPVDHATRGRAVALKLLQVEVQMPHRVLANLLARLAQLLPVRHLGDHFGALGLDHLGGVAHVLAQLRIAHQRLRRHLKLRRRPRIQSRSAHC